MKHQSGYLRDKAVVEAVERCGVLDTEQIRLLFFRAIASGERVAQRRLQTLCKRRRLNRDRYALHHPFFYYTGQRKGQLEHRIGVNWVYVWLLSTLKEWEVLHSWEYETDYKILRADAFAVIKNKVTGRLRFLFIEFDVATSGNDFDKVRKYNQLYQGEGYVGEWWAKLAERFPPVLIVTTTQSRARVIRDRIERDNMAGLEFNLYTLDNIKKGCGLWPG